MSINRILTLQRTINLKVQKTIFEHGTTDLESPKVLQSLKDTFQRTVTQPSVYPQKPYPVTIYSAVKATSKKMLTELKAMKKSDGATYFDEWFLSQVSKNNEYLKKTYKLAKMTSSSGNPRFAQYEIAYLKELSNKQIKKVPILAEMLDANGESLLDGYDIYKICKLSNKKFKKAIVLVKMKNSLNQPLFTGDMVCKLVEQSDKKIKKAIDLAQITDFKKQPLFNDNEILQMLDLTDNQLKRISWLKELKTISCAQRFDSYDIYKLCQINDKQFKTVPQLLEAKYPTGEYVFIHNGSLIQDLAGLPTEKLSRIPKLIKMKTNDGKPRFNQYDIVSLCRLTDKQFNNLDKFAEIQELSYSDIIFLLTSDRETLLQIPFIDKKYKLSELESIYNRFRDNETLVHTLKLAQIKQRIKSAMYSATTAIPVSNEAKTKFFKQAIALNNKEILLTIQDMDKVVAQYGKEGLPLLYKRQDFVKDLSKELENLQEPKREEILNKLGIEFTEDNLGYNGLLNLNKLNMQNSVEKKIKDLCEKFLLRNSIQTGDKNVDSVLNSLIQCFPEFINMIGKKHHGIHQYTIDCHTIKVLQSALSDFKFENLSNLDKICLQLVAILHDIGKREGINDKGHEFASAIYTQDILRKFNLPVSVKDRIVEIIKNHNWWEKLNKGEITEKEVAVMFRKPEDITIAEIFAKADLMGVNEDFYKFCIGDLDAKLHKCRELQQAVYEGGNILFPTRVINMAKIPRQILNGQEYKVVDFTKIPDTTDLFNYGLSIHKKSDFRALFHVGDFETVKELSNPVNEGVISTTLISPAKKRTHINSKFGIMLDTDNINIINSSYENQSSGGMRNFNNFIQSTLEDKKESARYFQQETFLEFLDEKYNLTQEQYGKLYKQLQDKRFLNQIKDVVIDDKIITKEDIIAAYKNIEEEIMKFTDKRNNEIIVYNPKIIGLIAKVQSLSEIPEDSLKFARENDLPIFIMGE